VTPLNCTNRTPRSGYTSNTVFVMDARKLSDDLVGEYVTREYTVSGKKVAFERLRNLSRGGIDRLKNPLWSQII